MIILKFCTRTKKIFYYEVRFIVIQTGDINKLKQQPVWLHGYIDSPEKQLYKKTLRVVILAQIFEGAGLAAGITVGALFTQDTLGTESAAGIPVALLTLGSARAALPVGRLSQRFGRGTGFAAGFLAGGLGAIPLLVTQRTRKKQISNTPVKKK